VDYVREKGELRHPSKPRPSLGGAHGKQAASKAASYVGAAKAVYDLGTVIYGFIVECK
jgi:hypothetical protein